MERFSLQTFVKICLMDTGSRMSEVQKKLESSNGYDYYNSFQRAVRAYCDDKTSTEPSRILSLPTRESERKHNIAAFEGFKAKFGSIRSLEVVKKARTFVPENATFEISIEPLFGIEKAGTKLALLPWAIQKPELTQRYAAVACFIMRQSYKSTNLGNWQFNLCDLTSGKTFSENQITENTPKILAADSRMISALLAET